MVYERGEMPSMHVSKTRVHVRVTDKLAMTAEHRLAAAKVSPFTKAKEVRQITVPLSVDEPSFVPVHSLDTNCLFGETFLPHPPCSRGRHCLVDQPHFFLD